MATASTWVLGYLAASVAINLAMVVDARQDVGGDVDAALARSESLGHLRDASIILDLVGTTTAWLATYGVVARITDDVDKKQLPGATAGDVVPLLLVWSAIVAMLHVGRAVRNRRIPIVELRYAQEHARRMSARVAVLKARIDPGESPSRSRRSPASSVAWLAGVTILPMAAAFVVAPDTYDAWQQYPWAMLAAAGYVWALALGAAVLHASTAWAEAVEGTTPWRRAALVGIPVAVYVVAGVLLATAPSSTFVAPFVVGLAAPLLVTQACLRLGRRRRTGPGREFWRQAYATVLHNEQTAHDRLTALEAECGRPEPVPVVRRCRPRRFRWWSRALKRASLHQ